MDIAWLPQADRRERSLVVPGYFGRLREAGDS